MERHGPEPEVLACTSRKQELNAIVERIEAFRNSAHNSLGIICKTRRQAARLHKTLAKQSSKIHLLDAHSATVANGVIVMSAYLAKGLEFD